ncbi:uncharacterized protein LOC126673736 isoform X2 [Mercurialis annua]|uniref:uncharacterized protein LOC126673736 isoform X2 n=1 Tax=Mercurialis annua TaxID=3986 RepID=UPI00215F975B|nr:uncharacterized protein LOC126673736 isoform X2 [Mercurialis annua]
MINGKGPASPDPFDLKNTSGGGGDHASPGSLSRYSSCGEESEFERYCSANSIMGTPSFCSTSLGALNDRIETEFGSLKSLDNFTLGGKLLNLEKKISSYHDEIANGSYRQEGVRDLDDSNLFSDFDGREDDEMSSRYDNDDDEEEDDSMYGCDSDDGTRNSLDAHRTLIYGLEEKVRAVNENPLLVNSSVAFGLDDWDDFEQETVGGTLASLTLANEPETETHHFNSTATASLGLPVVDNVILEPACVMQVDGNDLVGESNNTFHSSSQNSEVKQAEKVRDLPEAEKCPLRGIQQLANDSGSISTTSHHMPSLCRLEQEDMAPDPCVERNLMGSESNILDYSMERESLCMKTEQSIRADDSKIVQNQETGNLEVELKVNSTQLLLEPHRSKMLKNNTRTSNALFEDRPAPIKAEKVELGDFYDEIVNEMEEILLDSSESPGARFPQVNRMSQKHLSSPLRDGGSSASTSGADDTFSLISQPLRIDGIEVVGAKQKKGEISLSERLVGVKEYTVYRIRIWSGKDQWEVERRYRDFFTLYRRLKLLFADQGWTFPHPWSSVEKESRKIFGNASPDVVSERSVLIQDCLHSIIHSGYFSSPPSALFWFLCPQDSVPSSPASQKQVPWSVFSNREPEPANISSMGKTISLIVENRPYKSMKQLLEAQHYICAGCHKHFDDGMTLMQDFVQALGWGKPRLCEYTGQLFCSSCHTNESAVLPARVLHYWDFTPYPVSQLAKSYLDSIHEQPMLCVSAVNPFLFSKVPALHHIMSVRKKIGAMLSYIRCPFRRTINKGLGSRRYLLQSNDFFALKDLIDLSKGPFAALPVKVETVSRKIMEHITDQCLVCCDVGIPCNARQACDDPSSLIFPFQEGEIEKCTSCGSVFHKSCFKKLTHCSCGSVIGEDNTTGATKTLSRKASELLGRSSSSVLSMGLISGLFSRVKSDKINDNKDGDTVILMGSMPNTTL